MKGDNKIGFLTMWKIQAFIARSAVTLHAVMMKHLPRNFLVEPSMKARNLPSSKQLLYV